MKAAVYRVPGRTHEDQLVAFATGLQKHGIAAEFFDAIPSQDADFIVVWGWMKVLRTRSYSSRPFLVMERGYLGDRYEFSSLGWDGLNGRARFTKVDDHRRFDGKFAHLLRPWKVGGGYALIVGQVVGDAALIGTDIHKWYRETGVALWKQGWDVKFRQHPVEVQRGIKTPAVPFAEILTGSLEDALAGAGLVVTYNSNAGVDALLSGSPVYAANAGSMVYDLASRDFNPVKPDREERLKEMAWFQWSEDELRSGDAWDIVKESMTA